MVAQSNEQVGKTTTCKESKPHKSSRLLSFRAAIQLLKRKNKLCNNGQVDKTTILKICKF